MKAPAKGTKPRRTGGVRALCIAAPSVQRKRKYAITHCIY
jgi:hypothetical protein